MDANAINGSWCMAIFIILHLDQEIICTDAYDYVRCKKNYTVYLGNIFCFCVILVEIQLQILQKI